MLVLILLSCQLFNEEEGIRKISTETGAGQWGSALAMAGAFFGIEIEVFMVKISYQQKPYRRSMMNTFGATIHASSTNLTDAGRSILEKDPENMGSLGIAISEAVEVAIWVFPGSPIFPFFMGAFAAGEVLASVPVPYSGWASAASF